MVFSSLTFLLIFLPAFLILYFISGRINWRNGVLLIFSLLFYAWGEPVWIIAMLFATAVNYACGLVIGKTRASWAKKLILVFGVLISLSSLIYFKYAAFFVNSAAALFSLPVEIPALKLPIGISFYTFQILTYTVDVYRGDAPVQKNPMKLLLYVSCFPQLIAGPIVQYADIASALSHRTTSVDDFSAGMKRFGVGLGKKVLIANICGKALETLNPAASQMSVAGAWLSAFMFALQIYFDFSAYSDMAIGIGRIIGFKYKENFNYPYAAASITDFWRRWHMSLSGFFRKYVYIPLGGNRKGARRTAINILIVWSLTGLWHGASWNFILWGAYYGLLLLLEKFVLSRVIDKTPKAMRHVITLIAVLIGWVVFYHTNTSGMLMHLGAMVGYKAQFIDPVALLVIKEYTVFPLAACILSLPILPAVKKALSAKVRLEKTADALAVVFVTAVMVMSLLFLVGESFNPFIYFRF